MIHDEECCKGGMMGEHHHFGHKKFIGVALFVMLLSFAYAAVSYVNTYSQSIEPSSFRSFGVDGEGKIVAIPDVAKFSFGLTTEGGKDIAALQKENTEKMNKAIEFIKTNGVEAKDIKTENYSLNPRYQYFDCGGRIYSGADAKPCPPAEIVGYTINQNVSVKIRDFAKIGDILSGIIDTGANNVSQLSFQIDDPTALKDEARAQAIEKAQAKAKMVAKAGGFKVGRLLSIEEGSDINYPRVMYSKAIAMDVGFGGAEAAPAPAIEAGSQDVTVTVNLRYEIR